MKQSDISETVSAEKPKGEVDTAAISASEDHSDELPRSWCGRLSDSSFHARFENNIWILGVRVEAETPVVIQNAYSTVEIMQDHAEMLDFALAFARGDKMTDIGDIQHRAMGLNYASDLFGQTGENLKAGIKTRQGQIEIDVESLLALQRSATSANVLIRIAERIDNRLANNLDPAIIEHLKRAFDGSRTH